MNTNGHEFKSNLLLLASSAAVTTERKPSQGVVSRVFVKQQLLMISVYSRSLVVNSLPERRGDFCPWRWLKLETRRRNRRTRLVRIRRHDSIAVRQQHISAFDT